MQGVNTLERPWLREALELAQRLPWQPIADSPTVKSYTDWRFFEQASRSSLEPSYARPPGSWGRVIGPCGDAAAEAEPLLTSPRENRLMALHFARLENAYLLEPRGEAAATLCRPEPAAAWASQHLVVRLPEGEEARLLLYLPRAASGTTVVEVELGPKARLALALVAEHRAAEAAALVLRARLNQGSALQARVVATGARGQARLEELHILRGQGARLDARSYSVARGRERLDHILDVVQDAPETRADAAVKAVALDEALAVARGKAKLTERARRSHSVFDASVLMLGPRSRGYTAPMMEIDTGDVEAAAHHAAQHRIPQEVLHYLATRGLGPGDAARLILSARLQGLLEPLGSLAARAARLAAQAIGAEPLAL